MKITYDYYVNKLVDEDAECICHQASGDSKSCPYHYPKIPVLHDGESITVYQNYIITVGL